MIHLSFPHLSPQFQTDQLQAGEVLGQLRITLCVTWEQLPGGGHPTAVTIAVGKCGGPDSFVNFYCSSIFLPYLATNVWSSSTWWCWDKLSLTSHITISPIRKIKSFVLFLPWCTLLTATNDKMTSYENGAYLAGASRDKIEFVRIHINCYHTLEHAEDSWVLICATDRHRSDQDLYNAQWGEWEGSLGKIQHGSQVFQPDRESKK